MAVGLLVPGGVRGQLIVTPGTEFPANWTADSLVRNVLLGTGVTVSNVRLNESNGIINDGSTSSGMIGIFTTGEEETGLGIEEGIILTNGCADSVAGMNDDSGMTGWGCGNFYTCTLLEDLINDWANDVIVLEFDFVPMSDSIVFDISIGWSTCLIEDHLQLRLGFCKTQHGLTEILAKL